MNPKLYDLLAARATEIKDQYLAQCKMPNASQFVHMILENQIYHQLLAQCQKYPVIHIIGLVKSTDHLQSLDSFVVCAPNADLSKHPNVTTISP